VAEEKGYDMRQYRLGILGLGMIGRVHAYAASTLPFYYDIPFGVKLTGIYNRTYEKAQHAVETMGFEFAAPTPEELISRDDIDAICLCLPNHQHEKYAVMALEAGKHLYCEKPIATSYEAALRIQEAADKSGKVAQIVFNNRHFPAVLRAKQLMDEGRLGRLLSFQVMYNHSSNIDPGKAATWRFSQEYSGTGTLADMGSHAIDLLCFLAGPIDRLSAAMQTAIPQRPDGKGGMADVCVDDAAYMMAQLKNGAMGTITASKLATGTNDEMDIRLFGEKGALHFNADYPGTLDFYDNTDADGAYGGSKGFKAIESVQRYEKPGGAMPAPKLAIGWLRAHVHSLYTFFNCVHTGTSPSPSIADGVYNQYVLDKAVESAKTGTWVGL
jgi:predicted dehydrogenase